MWTITTRTQFISYIMWIIHGLFYLFFFGERKVVLISTETILFILILDSWILWSSEPQLTNQIIFYINQLLNFRSDILFSNCKLIEK